MNHEEIKLKNEERKESFEQLQKMEGENTELKISCCKDMNLQQK